MGVARAFGLVLAFAGAAAAQELVPLRAAADAFVAAGHELGPLGAVVREWRVPDLGRLEHVEVATEGRMFRGWRAGDVVLLGLYYVRRVPAGATVRRAAPEPPVDPAEYPVHGRAQCVLAHWVTAIRRGDFESAARMWRRLRERCGDATRPLFGELMFTWRTAWSDPARPQLALAALDAMESVASDELGRGVVRRQRAAVLATPREVPPPPPSGLPPAEEAAILVARFWAMETTVETIPGGTVVTATPIGRRLAHLGCDAYPALVAALGHGGLSNAWTGGLTWCEYVTYGAVARALLADRLGFVDTPAAMRRWIDSGTWRDTSATRTWFAEHAEDPAIRAKCSE